MVADVERNKTSESECNYYALAERDLTYKEATQTRLHVIYRMESCERSSKTRRNCENTSERSVCRRDVVFEGREFFFFFSEQKTSVFEY